MTRTRSTPSVVDYALRWLGHSPLPRAQSLVYRLGGLAPRHGRRFSVKFEGLLYSGDLGEYVDRYVWCFGAYAPEELNFLDSAAKILRQRRGALTFLDIGANVGQHSLHMSSRADRVLAFEPSLRAAESLQRKCNENYISNIELHRVALGATNGEATLGSGLPDNSGSRSLQWSLDRDRDDVVQVRHAGSYLTSPECALVRMDILKLDVEGFEHAVLASMRELLMRDRPVILFELVGEDVKGGFRSEAELRSALYPDHVLFSLGARTKAILEPFRWAREEAVCIPRELVAEFGSLIQ